MIFFAPINRSCVKEYPIVPFFEGEDESISEYIDSNAVEFSYFRTALLNTNLYATLSARNPHGNLYTLFLPTNEAFERFVNSHAGYQNIDELLSDQDYLSALVKYHIINTGFPTNEFSFGALSDTTISGDLLNIGFSGSWDSTTYVINNNASVIVPNIELANGYIHVIDEVLTPVVFNSMEWLTLQSEYSIFSDALRITGLKDTFNTINGIALNTLLIEPDLVYNKNKIYTIEDLINVISPDDMNYTSATNNLYQFVAYHIMDGKHFLNDFEGVNTNFNTYAVFPLYINGEGLDILINTSAQVFDTIITNNDTTIINSIGINYEASNILTKNGAIHQIDQMMQLYRPRPKRRVFRFYEEEVIQEARSVAREYVFNENDKSKFKYISWSGVEEIRYVKTSGIEAYDDDYIALDGNFEISYQIPKILPGEYELQIRAQTTSSSNASIWVYLDGKRIGGNIDLSVGPDKWGNEYRWMDVGTIRLEEFVSHTVTVKSLIEGTFYWDQIRFEY